MLCDVNFFDVNMDNMNMKSSHGSSYNMDLFSSFKDFLLLIILFNNFYSITPSKIFSENIVHIVLCTVLKLVLR